MEQVEFIKKLLEINQPMSKNPTRFSTIALLLKSSRKLFGCNLSSGIYEMNEIYQENFTDQTYQAFQFSGLINYLIFLDQIGSIFKSKNTMKSNKTNSIFCSLKYFSILEDSKIDAIVALRNCLTHKFGLATEKSKKPNSSPQKNL